MESYMKQDVMDCRGNDENILRDVFIRVPESDWAFLTELISRFGWQIETREQLLERFCNSRPQSPVLSDEDILAEVKAVRYGR